MARSPSTDHQPTSPHFDVFLKSLSARANAIDIIGNRSHAAKEHAPRRARACVFAGAPSPPKPPALSLSLGRTAAKMMEAKIVSNCEKPRAIFGLKLPIALQPVVAHGARLCELLEALEHGRKPRRHALARWLTGRAREVELAFEVTLFDWASGRLGVQDAAKSLEQYLTEVHAGAQQALGFGLLGCCEEDCVPTIPFGDASVEEGPARGGR